MEATNILILIVILIQSILFFAAKNWIIGKINGSTKHYYDKLNEDYKRELLIKQKSELIGALISEWTSFPEDPKKLNQLTFEAFLWLPKGIASDLSDLLSHKPDSKNVREIICAVRNHLLGNENNIDPNQIIVFDYKDKKNVNQDNISENNPAKTAFKKGNIRR